MHCLYFFGERKFYTRTNVNITREWKSTLGQHLQWVAFNYYIKSYPDRVYTPVTETPVSSVWRATTRSTRGSSFLSQKRRWNHCFCMWTGALSQGFRAGVRVIRYSHKLISAHKRVERFLTCQPRWRLYSFFMLLNSVTALSDCSLKCVMELLSYLLKHAPFLISHLRLMCYAFGTKKSLALTAPVR